MKAEADSGERPSSSRSANTTPKKPKSTPKKDKTIGGRVGKSSSGTNNETTPSKKRKGNGIKEEGGGSWYVYSPILTSIHIRHPFFLPY